MTVLSTIPVQRRTGSSRFSQAIPIDFADEWIRFTTVMSDADFKNPLNSFFLRLRYSALDTLVGGEIKWQGNPLAVELDRPDISFPVLHKRGEWSLRGETVSFELDLRNTMDIGAVIEGVTFSTLAARI